VMARHCARLGRAGGNLESAVWKALQAVDAPPPRPLEGCWRFLDRDPDGAFARERENFRRIYEQSGRHPNPGADARVKAHLSGTLGDLSSALPQPAASKRKAQAQSKRTGMIEVPISDLRFSHDDQSEIFAHNGGGHSTDHSVIQLAVELACGLTPLRNVETIHVVHHNGRWFCRTGNRRLAAMQLANHFAPHLVRSLWVKAVPMDDAFLYGRPGGRPKLTTQCDGRWIVLKQTGEVAGSDLTGCKTARYGAELLGLLLHFRAVRGRA